AGKSVLITAAAGAGIGFAAARKSAEEGCRALMISDIHPRRLEEAVAKLKAETGLESIWGQVCNVTNEEEVQALVAAAEEKLGGVDVLINNAGISHRSLFADTDPAVLRKVMEVNFFGVVHMTHAALPQLLARRGVVAALSSVAGYAPLLGRSGYCASKHALHGFFDTLRTEVQGRGVQVTLICPSFIATGIGAAGLGGSGRAATTPRITTGGESAPQDIAQRILAALAQGKEQLLPDCTSRLAWWVSRLAPGWYARTMQRRVRAEFEP
ncbi:MAG: SDR family oxidoreductase, partial [Giesbergeria sp.]